MQATPAGAFVSARFQAPFGAPWYTPTTAAVAPTLGTRFGEPWPVAGTQQAVSSATDRHYTGQRSFEASLGSLYHYGARWYSPVLGRFLSPDPIVPSPANPQALNRYSYVANNPLIHIDPSGYCKYAVDENDVETDQFDFEAGCTIADFEKIKDLKERRRWMRKFVEYWSKKGYDIEDWFNNVKGILRTFEDTGLGNNAWFDVVDAAILTAISEGMYRAENDGQFNDWAVDEAGELWEGFFRESFEDDPSDTVMRRWWGQAEQAATDVGMALADQRGLATPDAAAYLTYVVIGNVYRHFVSHPPPDPIGWATDPRRSSDFVYGSTMAIRAALQVGIIALTR